MKVWKGVFALFMILSIVGLTANAEAAPSAQFSYSESDLGGGTWQYNYTLFNTSDPVIDAGFDAYDVFLTFDSSAVLTITSLPAGWDSKGGDTGFVETFSLNPGEPPAGTDVAPGSSLSGFIFQFDQRMASLPFDVTLANPDDPENPVVFSDQTGPLTVSVPEPATFLFLVLALVGFRIVRVRWGRSLLTE